MKIHLWLRPDFGNFTSTCASPLTYELKSKKGSGGDTLSEGETPNEQTLPSTMGVRCLGEIESERERERREWVSEKEGGGSSCHDYPVPKNAVFFSLSFLFDTERILLSTSFHLLLHNSVGPRPSLLGPFGQKLRPIFVLIRLDNLSSSDHLIGSEFANSKRLKIVAEAEKETLVSRRHSYD